MSELTEWETPKFEAITDTDSRADQADIPVRNGLFSSGPRGPLGIRVT